MGECVACSVICGILGCVSCWLMVCVWVGSGGLFILSLLYMWAISSLWIVSSLSEGGRSSHASSHVAFFHEGRWFGIVGLLLVCVFCLLFLLL